MSIIKTAIKSEEARRKAIIKEILQLSDLIESIFIQNLDQEIANLVEKTLGYIDLCQHDIHILMKSLTNRDANYFLSYPLQTNKLNQLLEGAKKFLEQDTIKVKTKIIELKHNLIPLLEQKTIFDEIDSYNEQKFTLGNSNLNFLQTALLSVWAAYYNKSDLRILHEDGIYILNKSPVFHQVDFPMNFTIPINISNNCIFYSNVSLHTPSLGYSLGGSRSNIVHYEYKNKDCSQFIGEIIGFNTSEIYTGIMNKFAKNQCGDITACINLAKYLKIQKEPFEGCVYLTKSHTGLVVKVNENSFESLSYSRNMPYKEGFGYNNVSIENPELIFFEIKPILLGSINDYDEL